MNLKEWNRRQIAEALGEVNRYFFGIVTGKNPKDATEDELVEFYATHGGARDFAKKHRGELK
jgi:hypothetical protein